MESFGEKKKKIMNHDGNIAYETRMLYADWLKNFEQVQICNLSPDSFQGQLTAQQV